jgi:hypothetical protein
MQAPPESYDYNDGPDDDDDLSSQDSLRSYHPPTLCPSDDEESYHDDSDDDYLIASFGITGNDTEARVSNGIGATSLGRNSLTLPSLPSDDTHWEYPGTNDDLDLSISEMAMLDLLILCDTSGAPCGLYDDLLTLLCHHRKKGFDVTKAKGWQSFLSDMRKKVPTPQPLTTMVRDHQVVYFPFLEMLRVLLRTSMFNDVSNLCVNRAEEERFSKFHPTALEDHSEIMAKQWAQETYNSLDDFNPETDLFVPINLYADKTGTDINQWYPLEPWMFTTPILRRSARESANCWCHLGFAPSLGDMGSHSSTVDEDQGPASADSQDKLQLYHDFLLVLLQGLKDTCKTKPVLKVNLGGIWQRKRLHLHVTVVMGDQKSQDYLCGRKSTNSGNAGRVHRSCMASAVSASNVSTTVSPSPCWLVSYEVVHVMNKLALTSVDEAVPGTAQELRDALPMVTATEKREYKRAIEYLKQQKRLAVAILGRVYSMHPLRNAFAGVPFGANQHGIFVTTTEDHLHATESAIMFHVAEVAYHGMTAGERSEFEQIIRTKVSGCWSSALSDYPWGTTKKNFGLLTF